MTTFGPISAVEFVVNTAAVTLSGGGSDVPPTNEGSAGIQATIKNPTLAIAPGSLVVAVANGEAGATATLSVPGNLLADTTVVLDDTGAAPGVNVPVSLAATGNATLTVTDGTSTVTPTFTVSSLATPGSFVVPTYTPPAAVQNTTGVRKWVFQDPATGEVYHFPYNPNQMTSPYGTKNIQWTATTAIDGQKLAFEGQQAPVQWQFQGFIRSQDEYDAFVYWAAKRNRIWITDHYGRAWLGYLTHFDPVARRTAHIPWSHDYTMQVLLFDGPVTPV